MSLLYRVMYGLGFKPWEQDGEATLPQLRTLLAAEGSHRKPPYGSALDLGCGTGRWSVELAQQGWEVVGVDVIPKAIRGARERAEAAGVNATFIEGDVTALRYSGVGRGFSFVLDVECFNHLNDAQRVAVGREVDAVTTDDARMLLLVWRRAHRGPMPPGANREHIEHSFPSWRISGEWPYEGALPRPLRSIQPRWYRLERHAAARSNSVRPSSGPQGGGGPHPTRR